MSHTFLLCTLGNDLFCVKIILPDGSLKILTAPLSLDDTQKLYDCLSGNFHKYSK